jgi:hypothetical protein
MADVALAKGTAAPFGSRVLHGVARVPQGRVMRALILLLMTLAGCAGPLPAADPRLAWVEMRSSPTDVLMADQLDGVRTPDGRYFQLSPGTHRLQARYDFEISRGAAMFDDGELLHCRLLIVYDGFQAGQRYRFQARALGWQPQAWLLDDQGRQLAEAQVLSCR